jgi:hypothetical protein
MELNMNKCVQRQVEFGNENFLNIALFINGKYEN